MDACPRGDGCAARIARASSVCLPFRAASRTADAGTRWLSEFGNVVYNALGFPFTVGNPVVLKPVRRKPTNIGDFPVSPQPTGVLPT